MFYIISSRIPLISSDFTKRKYFKVFVFGSVFYVLLHYYLNKQITAGIPEKMKKYLFYIMGVDFTIACILLKYIKTAVPEEEPEDDDNDSENDNDGQHNNQKQLDQSHLTKELEEQRRLFLEEHQRRLLHEKIMEQKALEQRAIEQRALQQKALEEAQKKKQVDTEKSESEKSESDKNQKIPLKQKVLIKKEQISDKKEIKKEIKKEMVAEKKTVKTENESELNTESELPIYDK
jgi:hypothetical protein